jgi:hypothetical protein
MRRESPSVWDSSVSAETVLGLLESLALSRERASSAAAVHKRNMQAPVLVRALPLLLTVLHSVEGYGSGSPSFGMPNSYNMVREAMMHMQIECLLART